MLLKDYVIWYSSMLTRIYLMAVTTVLTNIMKHFVIYEYRCTGYIIFQDGRSQVLKIRSHARIFFLICPNFYKSKGYTVYKYNAYQRTCQFRNI